MYEDQSTLAKYETKISLYEIVLKGGSDSCRLAAMIIVRAAQERELQHAR
jgi:hypothetical protein